MPVMKPISLQEFSHVMDTTIFKNLRQGLPTKLAVANSGGPDSTCLLFLLKNYLLKTQPEPDAPCPSLISLSVDHALQECSSAMSSRAEQTATALGIKHYGTKIPWGLSLRGMDIVASQNTHTTTTSTSTSTPTHEFLSHLDTSRARHFPPKPTSRIEAVAREARYGVLYEWMHALGARALFTGHHADDQVETMMMRMSLGSSVLGMAGMRPVRRWGMGSGEEGDCVHYGMGGMGTWHIRPLLDFSKDRILATCEENKLDYVNDPTNFQPEYGLRNAVRHALKSRTATGLSPEDPTFKEYLPEHAESLALINNMGANHDPPFGLGTPPDKLREIVNGMSKASALYEEKVRDFAQSLDGIKIPGTFAIPLSALDKLQNDTERRVFLYAAVRYISPRPWGHRAAELGRRKSKVDALVQTLWGGGTQTRAVTPGSDVCWTLSKWDPQRSGWSAVLGRRRPDNAVWLITRMKPRFKNGEAVDLSIDITDKINHARRHKTVPGPVEILFDNRFLCTFDVTTFDQDMGDRLNRGFRMYIRPGLRASSLPRVTLEMDRQIFQIHDAVVDEFGNTNQSSEVERPSITLRYIRPFFE